jgi:hypothetical protein
MTLVFILVPVGAVRPVVACLGHCIALHQDARRGGLQAWRERRPGLQVPDVLIEASANIMVKAESVRVIAIRLPPCGWGIALPFIGQEGSSLQACRIVLATCEGMAYSATELTTVLVNLSLVGASWRVLFPYRSEIRG